MDGNPNLDDYFEVLVVELMCVHIQILFLDGADR